MPTLNQLSRDPRVSKIRITRYKALGGAPVKKGFCYQVSIFAPRKPNSAKRKVAKVKVLTTKRNAFAGITGIGEHGLQAHSAVLLRAKGPNDVPGVNYRLVRGVYDFCISESFMRSKRRSKFGVAKRK